MRGATNVVYSWNQQFTQAEVSWRDRQIGVLLVPKFAEVPGMRRAAYVFNERGEFKRFDDEASARAFILKCVERAEETIERIRRVAS